MGKGCAIEYNFSLNEAHNCTFGKVQYGKWKLKPLKKIQQLADEFAIKNNNFRVQSLPLFLSRISAFHKEIKFQNENEIRFLYYRDGGFGNDKTHLNGYSDFYKNDEVRNFIKIFIKGWNPYVPHPNLKDDEAIFHSPQIEISRIFIGPNVKSVYETCEQLLKIKKLNKLNFEIWIVNKDFEFYKI